MEKKVLTAGFFGQLQIVYKGIALTEDGIHSEMITKLLAYMLLHRNRAMTVRELSDMLWNEDNISDNPGGALKNLMYRLRNVMKKTYGEEEQFVLTKLGSYCWNSEIAVSLDSEEFEKEMKAGRQPGEIPERIATYEKAVQIYRGRFLDKHISEQWVVPLTAYYHSMFLSGVKDLSALYEKQGRFEEMEEICTKALEYERLDEEIHCLELKSLIRQRKQNMALEYYEKTVKLFYDNLGIRNLPGLKKVYEQILSMKRVSETAEVEVICQDVQESGVPKGAYICGYAVFRELYRIEARRIKRTGVSECVLLLTLVLKKEIIMAESAERYFLNRAMDRMETVLCNYLRIGDVISRYGDSQFLILLPACTYESAKKIAWRIIRQFEKDVKNQKYKVDFSLEEVKSKHP